MPDRLKLNIKSCLNDLNSEDNASRRKCASTPLWLVVSLIKQVGSKIALIMFLTVGCTMMVGGAA